MLPSVQASVNNSRNEATGLSPNEVLYGFRLREGIDLLPSLSTQSDKPHGNQDTARTILRAEAADAIAWAAQQMKIRFDIAHTPLRLQEGDQAYIQLHKHFHIPGITNRKLHHQGVGPFAVVRAFGSQAYKLRLPPTCTLSQRGCTNEPSWDVGAVTLSQLIAPYEQDRRPKAKEKQNALLKPKNCVVKSSFF